MKKQFQNKYLIYVMISLIICTGVFLICGRGSDKVILDEVKLKSPEKDNGMFAIMVEQSDNSDMYEQSEDNIFPGTGYYYNETKSGCVDNNNKEVIDVLVYDRETKKFSVRTKQTIYCYLYFSKDSTKPTIGNITLKGTAENTFTLAEGYTHTKDIKVTTSWEDDDVESYCISINNDSGSCLTWENAEGKIINEKEFTINDTEGEQTLYVYLKDKSGNISDSPGNGTITLDKTNPVITKTTKTSDEETKIIFNVEITESGYNGAGIKDLTCSSGSYSCTCVLSTKICTLSGLSAGTSHSITVTATDLSGRKGTKNETYQTKAQPTLSETIKGKSKGDVTTLNGGYLIYHDGTGTYGSLEAGDKSYRFSGNNPDNYVCLDGNTSTSTCSVGKLYRVIGIFPKEGNPTEYTTKLIKSEYITSDELGGGLESASLEKYTTNTDYTPRADDVEKAVGFYWSGESSINYNNWIKSTLNETLNNEKGTYLTSLKAYTDANLIEETTWYIGGNTENNIIRQTSMKEAYDYELGEKKLKAGEKSCTDNNITTVQCTEALLYEENKKVGLMYATEYGYASAPSNWSSRLFDYDNAKNRGENWLYNGVPEWTLSRRADLTNYAFDVRGSGFVSSYSVNVISYGVRPVLVLKSNATVKSGDGSKNKPWRINLNS